jgi:hypothetical protein
MKPNEWPCNAFSYAQSRKSKREGGTTEISAILEGKVGQLEKTPTERTVEIHDGWNGWELKSIFR